MAIDNLEGAMRRLKACLAMANDGRANVHEAATALRAAQAIMAKYQIDHTDVILANLTDDEIISSDHVAYTHTDGVPLDHIAKTIPKWCSTIAASLAPYTDTGAVITSGKFGKRVRFFGMREDVMLAGWLYDYLLNMVRAMCKSYAKSGGTGSEVGSYRKGIAGGICDRLVELVEERKLAQQKLTSTGRELAIKKFELVEKKFGKVEYEMLNVNPRDSVAFGVGASHGRAIDLNVRGIETTPEENLLQIGN